MSIALLPETNLPISKRKLPLWFWMIMGAMAVYASAMAFAGFAIVASATEESGVHPGDVWWAWLILFIGSVIYSFFPKG